MFGRSRKTDKLGDKIKPLDTRPAATAPEPASAGPSVASTAAPSTTAHDVASIAMTTAAPGQPPSSPDAEPDLSPQELKRRAAAVKLVSAAFGQVVSVLMRAPHYKHYSLADLEWMVVPALVSSQFSIVEAQSRKSGLAAPVCVVLWAHVSAEVDQRLSAAPGEPVRLKPHEWRSGDILWVVDAIGDARAVTAVIKRLREHEWKGKAVKLRTRGKDGRPLVRVLEPRTGEESDQSAA